MKTKISSIVLSGLITILFVVASTFGADEEPLLVNPNFEMSAAGGVLGWRVDMGTYPGRIERVTAPATTPREGEACLKIMPGPEKMKKGVLRTAVYNDRKLEVQDGQKCIVKVWARGQGTARLSLMLQMHGKGGTWYGGLWPIFKEQLTEEWREYSGAATIKAVDQETGASRNVAYVRLAFDIMDEASDATGQSCVYVDDVKVEIQE